MCLKIFMYAITLNSTLLLIIKLLYYFYSRIFPEEGRGRRMRAHGQTSMKSNESVF